MPKLNLAVVFGGRTVEHDVSIVTALQFMDNADKEKYNLIPLYISRDGKWYTGEKLRNISFFEKFDAGQATQVYLEPTDGSRAVWPVKQPSGIFAGGRKPWRRSTWRALHTRHERRGRHAAGPAGAA